MKSKEREIVILSALEHMSYCPRQCALIHLEGIFDENVLTVRGRFVHEMVDEPKSTVEAGIRIERSLPLWCERLGLVGKADLVEFHGSIPYPVEYKHGKRRKWGHEDLQLCGQAICLEEMFEVEVPHGAIYHHSSGRRREVKFTTELREKVEGTVEDIRNMLSQERLPLPFNDARCRNCSLADPCMPGAVLSLRDKSKYSNYLFCFKDS